MPKGTNAGERFARALAGKQRDELLAILAPELDFRGMTPKKNWEATQAADFVDRVLLGSWFEPTDHITELQKVESDAFADCERVGYRLAIANPEGNFLCEQQAYFRVADGRIQWLRVMCAGYRRVQPGERA